MLILENVSKVFGLGNAGLDNLSLVVEPGEFVFLVGPTGSGKTTLLRLLMRQYLPSSGKISVADIDLVKLPKRKLPHYRKKIGIIFQDLKLLMDRTIFENVLLPLEITGAKSHHARKRVEELLTQVGMLEHKSKFPMQLSGGELQRIAIARALTLSPAILLADEPTGNLDSKTAFDIVDLINDINKSGTTIIMATHNLDILKKYPKYRVISLRGGKLESDSNPKKSKQPESVQKSDEKVQKNTEVEKVKKESSREEIMKFEKEKDLKDKSILAKILEEEKGEKHGGTS